MSIGRDSLSYWTSQVGNFAIAFVTMVFVAVILGPERRGTVNAVILANTLTVNLTNLGLQATAMYFVGKQREGLARFHTLLVVIVLGIVSADLVLLVGAGGWLRERIFPEIAWRLLAFGAAALPFSLYLFAAQGVMTGLGRVRELARFLFYYGAAASMANLLIVVTVERKVEFLLASWFASQAGGALVLFFMIRRSGCRWNWPGAAGAADELRRMLSYGLRAFAGNFASVLLNRLDHVFIVAMTGPIGIGVYSLSAKLAELVYQPSASLENAGFGRVARAEGPEAARLVQDIFRANLFINGSVMLVFFALAGPFVLLFLGDEYAAAAAPLRVLLPGTLCLSASRMLALYFSAQLGRPQIPSAIAWVVLAVNVPLMGYFVGSRGSGLMGAATVTSSCYALMLVIYLALFTMRTGLADPRPYCIPQRRDFDRLRSLAKAVRSDRSL